MGLLKKRKILSDVAVNDCNDRANILLCSDKNVIRGLGVTVISVLENMTMPVPFILLLMVPYLRMKKPDLHKLQKNIKFLSVSTGSMIVLSNI